MAKFKVGDKVRINDVDRINYGDFFWRNGDVTEVMEVDDDGDILVKVTRGIFREEAFLITKREFDYIEKVAETPTKLTKNQRIKALEQAQARLETEVATLKRRIEALEQGKSYTHTPRLSVEDVKPVSANQKRKAIIDEAKAFVEDVTKRMSQYGHGNKLGEHGEITTSARGWVTKAEFLVNAKKRTVVALARGIDSGNIYAKGIAKCAPDDVFNEHIGKAIALGRALGLDVTRFEQAVQPTEVVVGQRVFCGEGSYPTARNGIYTVKSIPQTETEIGGVLVDAFNTGRDDRLTWVRLTELSVADDTEAEY